MALNSKKKSDTEARPEIPIEAPIVEQQTHSLEKVVAESRERLADEEPPLPHGTEKKETRGRKSNAQKAAEAAEAERVRKAEAELVSQSMRPALKYVVELPYQLAAQKTSFKGFELNSEESTMLADQVNQVLIHYLPQLPEKHAPIFALLSAVAVVTLGKFLSYQRFATELDATKSTSNVASH